MGVNTVTKEVQIAVRMMGDDYKRGLKDLGSASRTFTNSAAKDTEQLNKAMANTASLQRLGAERVTKYGTAVGLLSGKMQDLKISNDLVGKGTSVLMDIMSGSAGPFGIAIAALGGLAAYAASAATEQRRLREEILETMGASLKLAALNDPTGEQARLLLEKDEQILLGLRVKLLEKNAKLMKEIARLRASPGDREFGPESFSRGSTDREDDKLGRQLGKNLQKLLVIEEKLKQINQFNAMGPATSEGWKPPSLPAAGGLLAAGGLTETLKTRETREDLVIIKREIQEIRRTYADYLLTDVELVPLKSVLGDVDKAKQDLAELAQLQAYVMDGMYRAAFQAAAGSTDAWATFAKDSMQMASDAAAHFIQMETAKRAAAAWGGGFFASLGGSLLGGLAGGLVGLAGGALLNLFAGNDKKQSSPSGSGEVPKLSSPSGPGGKVSSVAGSAKPVSVTYVLNTTVNGNVVGPQGMDELVDDYIIPRINMATALSQTG